MSKMEDIRQYKVTNNFMNNGRWFVYFDKPFNGKKVMARAIYNWLLGNPQFEDLPPGYCVHHLDLDELNNDISNLALMKSNHHMAYHTKQNKNNESGKVNLRYPIGIGKDLTIPRVTCAVSRKTQIWRFRWQETDMTEKRVQREINRIDGKIFRTSEEAERGKSLFIKMHPDFRSEEKLSEIYKLIQKINQDIDPQEMEDAYHLIKERFPQI